MYARVQSAVRALPLVLGIVLVAWGVLDYVFPAAVLRVQARILPLPDQSREVLAEHKRRIGLVCILAGLLAIAAALG